MRVLKNKSEREFQIWAEEKGWTVSKRGWPDFFCKNERGEVVLVEVKSAQRYRLRKDQWGVMEELVKFGVPCYKWTPDTGFVPVKKPKPCR